MARELRFTTFLPIDDEDIRGEIECTTTSSSAGDGVSQQTSSSSSSSSTTISQSSDVNKEVKKDDGKAADECNSLEDESGDEDEDVPEEFKFMPRDFLITDFRESMHLGEAPKRVKTNIKPGEAIIRVQDDSLTKSSLIRVEVKNSNHYYHQSLKAKRMFVHLGC